MDTVGDGDRSEQPIEATGDFPIMLVPLDGSTVAEQALPIAARLALAHGSTILLAHVTPQLTWAFSVPGGFATPDMFAALLAAEDRDAHDYLERAVARLESNGLRVWTLAVRGDPVATLLDLVRQTPADLVVMTTHGRTGLERFALGSVADRLVRLGTAPVLLLSTVGTFDAARSNEQPKAPDDTIHGVSSADAVHDAGVVALTRAHIPLDGSALAESAFTVAAKLAGATVQSIVLVRAVMGQPGSRAADEAHDYLVEARLRLTAKLPPGVCDVSTRVLFGSAAEAICDEAEKDADMVIMATHGLTGARRWLVGSVADRVLQAVQVPLLLVRAFAPGEPPEARVEAAGARAPAITRAGATP